MTESEQTQGTETPAKRKHGIRCPAVKDPDAVCRCRERECLRCEALFMSRGPSNALCGPCNNAVTQSGAAEE